MADNGDEYQAGGRASRVISGGVVELREGEMVFPAAGSEAQAEVVADDARAVIHYYFPVEIEVRSAHEAASPRATSDDRSYRLPRGLRSV